VAAAEAARSAAEAAAPGDVPAMSEEDHRELQAAAVEADGRAQRSLLAGDRAGAEPFLLASELHYRASWEAAPPGGYGRLVGMLKSAILRDESAGAAAYARSALGDEAESPTAAYALALAYLALDDAGAAAAAAGRMAEGGEAFERTAAALGALAHRDAAAYEAALRAVIADFESRDVHLTGVAIADTALVLERLAEPRGMAQHPVSRVMP
jgi:hypothetical protein